MFKHAAVFLHQLHGWWLMYCIRNAQRYRATEQAAHQQRMAELEAEISRLRLLHNQAHVRAICTLQGGR